MKFFFKRLFLFLLPVAIILIAIEFSIRQIPNSYMLKSNFLNENSQQIETLILGSSHTFYGVNPKYLNSTAFNMSNISQSPALDLAILQTYKDVLPNLKTIIVRLSYDTLFEQLKNSSEDWRLKDYKLYTDIDFEYALKHNSEILSMGLKQSLLVLKSEYLDDMPRLNCDSLGFGNDLVRKAERNIFENGKEVAKRHTATNWDLLDVNIEAFHELIQLCKSKEIKVLLITPPAYKSYSDNLNELQLEKMIEVGNKLNATYSNCTYLNYLSDVNFIEEDFYDADHLNANGAMKFSRLLNLVLED